MISGSADSYLLTRWLLSSTAQSLPRSAGYGGSHSGLSFWIGATTTAALRGLPDDLNRSLISGLVLLICYICTSAGSLARFLGEAGMAFGGLLLLGLGASGLASRGLWCTGQEPPSPVCVSPEAFGMAGGGSWLGCG